MIFFKIIEKQPQEKLTQFFKPSNRYYYFGPQTKTYYYLGKLIAILVLCFQFEEIKVAVALKKNLYNISSSALIANLNTDAN
jgi:hypothetical protein